MTYKRKVLYQDLFSVMPFPPIPPMRSTPGGGPVGETVTQQTTVIAHSMQYAAQVIAAAFTAVAFSGSPEVFAKPFPAAQQRFGQDWINQPPASIVGTPTPLQGINTSPEQFGRPFPVGLQRFPDFVPRGTIVTPQFIFSESPPQLGKPYAVTLQRFPDLAPFGYAATTGPLTFSESPPQFGKPYAVTLQRLPDFTPRGTIVTPQFIFSESPPKFGSQFPGAQQQFGQADVVIPPVTTTPWVGEPLSVKFFVPSLPAPQQRFPDFVPQGTVVSVTPQGGYYEGFPPQFGKPFPAALQTLPGLAPFGYAATTGPLTFAQSPDQFWKPAYAVTLQRYPDFVPFGYAATTGPLRFTQSPDLFAKPFPAPQQQYSASFGYLAPSQFIAQTYVQWPEQFRRPLNVSLQQYVASSFAPANPTPGPLQGINPYPDVFAKPYPAQLQRWPDFTPRGTIVTPQFIFSESPVRFAAPFVVSLQRYQDFAPLGTVVSTTPQGGYYEGMPPRFAVPFPAAQQRFEDFAPVVITIAVVVPPGLFSESPTRFGVPFQAYRQQFEAMRHGAPLSPLGTGKRRPLLLQNSSGTTFGGGPSYWPDGNG